MDASFRKVARALAFLGRSGRTTLRAEGDASRRSVGAGGRNTSASAGGSRRHFPRAPFLTPATDTLLSMRASGPGWGRAALKKQTETWQGRPRSLPEEPPSPNGGGVAGRRPHSLRGFKGECSQHESERPRRGRGAGKNIGGVAETPCEASQRSLLSPEGGGVQLLARATPPPIRLAGSCRVARLPWGHGLLRGSCTRHPIGRPSWPAS